MRNVQIIGRCFLFTKEQEVKGRKRRSGNWLLDDDEPLTMRDIRQKFWTWPHAACRRLKELIDF